MLHATVQGKSMLYERYLGRRDDGEQRVHGEDEITSAILGPLDFMAPAEVGRFWRSLLRVSGREGFFPDAAPEAAEMRLWSRRTSRSGRSIEPDAVVRLRWTGGEERILLVELKWRAPLSGNDQLHLQWNEYLHPEEREHALHVFIAPEAFAAFAALNDHAVGGNVWLANGGTRLLPITWLRVRGVLAGYRTEDSPLGRWAFMVDGFLQRVEIRRFSGFFGLETHGIPAEVPEHVFWGLDRSENR